MEEHERDFNQTVLYGRDSDLDQILAAARQFPMMAERRLVLVKEAQELREWRSKEKLEKLAAYADNPVSSTVLVLVHRNKMPDKRLSAVKRIQKAGVVFQSDRIRDYKLPEWILTHVSANKRRIAPRTAQILAEYLGNDLKKIAGEMEKLFIALPEGGEVSDVLIEQHIGISKEYNIFELTNALIREGCGPGHAHCSIHEGEREKPPCPPDFAHPHELFRAHIDVSSLAQSRPSCGGLCVARPFHLLQRSMPVLPGITPRKKWRGFLDT